MFKKMFTFLAMAALMSMNVAFANSLEPLDYDDVRWGDTYFDAIAFLTAEGVISGNPDGTYAPDRTLNRAEMLKILVESTVEDTEVAAYANADCFVDVHSGEWYAQYVCYAKARGWVVGYNNGTEFRPAQTVSFVEALKMTLEAYAISYDEDNTIWYRTLVNVASSYNYIPFDIRSFHNGLRRDQMADLVTRVIKHREDRLQDYLGTRSDVVVTYGTIEAGVDLSLEIEVGKVEAGTTLSVELFEQNDSGQSGMVTITELTLSNGLLVAIEVTPGEEDVEQPVHIHENACADIGAIKWSLNNVVNGHSTTTLGISMEDFLLEAQNQLSINLHKSVPEASVYYACGDITL